MGNEQHNVNDNVKTNVREYNVNDNVRVRSTIKERAADVDRIADHLVRKFQAPGSRPFFCKCAWKLSEDAIWTAYEQAHGPKVNSPIKYFVTLCNLKMSQ